MINSALDYYSDNHNREHYTRSLLYKGAYYEFSVKQPVEAMKCYKQAEDNADSTDYLNLAQINMRMGMLYYNNYASNNLDLEKFKNAYKYYTIVHDKQMIMIALEYIGCLYRETDKAKAVGCLSKAKDMAHELCDTFDYYTILNNLSMAFFMDSSFVKAKETAVECINKSEITNAMLFNAANAYAALNMPDSASFFLSKVNRINISDYDRMMIAFSQAYISKARGNINEALKQENYATAISDTIKAKSKRNDIFETEEIMNTKLSQGNKLDRGKITNMKTFGVLGLMIFITIVGILIYNVIKKHQRHKILITEIRENQELIENLLKENQRNINTLKSTKEQNESLKQQYINQASITDYLNDYFNSFNYLLQKSHVLSRSKFVEEFQNTVALVSQDDRFWDIIRIVADKKSNNLITRIENKCPSLVRNEIKVLCLVCLGYKNDAIAASLKLEKSTVKSLKTKIKNKIGASINLEAYMKLEMYNN